MLRNSANRVKLLGLWFFTALLFGCGTIQVPEIGDQGFDVRSEPAGATVSILGDNIGVTPLRVRHADIFPVNYPPEMEALYGKLVLAKPGCREHVEKVTNRILSKGADIQLECGSVSAPQTSAETEMPLIPASRVVPVDPSISDGSMSLRERLVRLEALYHDGLLTDEEHDAARRRILEAL